MSLISIKSITSGICLCPKFKISMMIKKNHHETNKLLQFVDYTSEIRLNHISTAFFMLYEINNNKKIKIYYILTLTLNLYVSTSPTRQPTIRCLGCKPQRQLDQADSCFL